jgi:hypothetical protein
MITLEEFEQAVQSLHGYFGVVGVFGGNPCTHPQFEEICSIMRRYIPQEQRGIWTNNLLGKGHAARITFNPAVSNLNVHCDRRAYDEFWRDWPESRSVVKGLDHESRHSPPYVAMQDVIPDEGKRWELIADCDINKYWSAMICAVPGVESPGKTRLRAYFCEIAGAMAMLHAGDSKWPDVGVEVTPGWWKASMQAYAQQVRTYCHACGVPLRRFGALESSGPEEEVSQTHVSVYKPKKSDRRVKLVTLENAESGTLTKATDYVENGALPQPAR